MSDRSNQRLRAVAYIGHLSRDLDPGYRSFVAALRRSHSAALREMVVDYVGYPANSEASGVREIGAELRQRKPLMLIAPTGPAMIAANRVHGRTPLVFSAFQDPMGAGVVDSMQASRAAVTGISLADGLHAKRLEILRDAFPATRRVAVLADREWREATDVGVLRDEAAKHLHLELEFLYAETSAEVVSAMADDTLARYDAWYFPPTAIEWFANTVIIARLRALDRPAIFGSTQSVERGGALGYEQDQTFVWGALADLVERVNSGEFAGSIPVQMPRRAILSVRTDATTLTRRVAPEVIRRADVVY